MDVVHKPPFTADLDDGNPLAVPRLELRITVDRDLAQIETLLLLHLRHDAAGRLTQMAALGGVENDFGYG